MFTELFDLLQFLQDAAKVNAIVITPNLQPDHLRNLLEAPKAKDRLAKIPIHPVMILTLLKMTSFLQFRTRKKLVRVHQAWVQKRTGNFPMHHPIREIKVL